jgi:hypothetical protein
MCERREERECNFIIRIMMGMLRCYCSNSNVFTELENLLWISFCDFFEIFLK